MDINQVVVFGRVGKDPELRETPNGDPICSFAIANSTFKKDASQKSGWAEETSWFDVTVFGDAAQRFVDRTKKGHRIIVSGSLKQRTWEDKEGNRRERVSIIARGIQFLEKKPKTEEAPQEEAPPVEALDEVPF